MGDAAYNLRARGIIWPTTFSDGSPASVSDLKEKDDLIIALTLSYLFQIQGDLDRAGRWWVTYKSMLADAIKDERERPDMDRLPTVAVQDVTHGPAYYEDPFVQSVP